MAEDDEPSPEHPGHVPTVIEGRVGLSAFVALFVEGFRALGADAHLRASFVRWSALGLAFTVGFSAGVAQMVSPAAAAEASLGAVAWWLFGVSLLVGGISLLETPEGRRVNFYGWPNGLSIVRAWACLPLMLAAALPLGGDRSLIIWCSVGGPVGLLDLVDGWIARRFGPLTRLGQALDPAGDALYFSVAAVGSVLVGIIPAWLAVLVLLRYLGPLLATPVVFLARRRPQLVHTEWGRRSTLAFGVLLFVCMIVRLADGNVEWPAILVGIPILGVTTVFHFYELGRRAYDAPVVMPTLRERLEARAAAREQRGERPRGE